MTSTDPNQHVNPDPTVSNPEAAYGGADAAEKTTHVAGKEPMLKDLTPRLRLAPREQTPIFGRLSSRRPHRHGLHSHSRQLTPSRWLGG